MASFAHSSILWPGSDMYCFCSQPVYWNSNMALPNFRVSGCYKLLGTGSCISNPWSMYHGHLTYLLKKLRWNSCNIKFNHFKMCNSVQFSCSVVSNSLWPHELQDARLSCPSPTPGACSNSCPSSWWCQPTISSSVAPFSSCLQSFPASESFPRSQFKVFQWH